MQRYDVALAFQSATIANNTSVLDPPDNNAKSTIWERGGQIKDQLVSLANVSHENGFKGLLSKYILI